jgi:hypothetical protein
VAVASRLRRRHPAIGAILCILWVTAINSPMKRIDLFRPGSMEGKQWNFRY